MTQFLDSLVMTGLAVTSVGLWTLRVALTARGRKIAGSITASAEALVFLLAFSRVISNIDEVGRVAGYALGVGIGTLVGLIVDERLSAGQSEVRIVTKGNDLSLVSELHALGWPITWTRGTGPFGDVTVGFVAVDDGKIRRLLAELERRSPDAFWTVEALRKAQGVSLGRGWIQIGHRFQFRHLKWPVVKHPRRDQGRPSVIPETRVA
jgi:uncharacterized protein YebE (UPF0316 family)